MTNYNEIKEYLPKETFDFLQGQIGDRGYDIIIRWSTHENVKFQTLARDKTALLERVAQQEKLENEALSSEQAEQLANEGAFDTIALLNMDIGIGI